MSKDCAPILRSPVRSLSIHLGGIMQRKKCIQQSLVGKTRWIESNLNNLRMAGAVGTNFFIGWVFEVAAFVSHGRIDNTCDLAETGFNTPKTSCTKCCFFDCHFTPPLLIGCPCPCECHQRKVSSREYFGRVKQEVSSRTNDAQKPKCHSNFHAIPQKEGLACRPGPLRVGRSLRDGYTPSVGASVGRERDCHCESPGPGGEGGMFQGD